MQVHLQAIVRMEKYGRRESSQARGKVILEKSRALRGGRELDALSLGERGRELFLKSSKRGEGKERERERGKEGEEGLGEVGLW